MYYSYEGQYQCVLPLDSLLYLEHRILDAVEY